MKSTSKEDVMFYTLQSFVGNCIGEESLTSRQKEAIERLKNLKEEKYYELCNDISNDIYRRTGMAFDTNNKMWKKFAMLSDSNFKNLVIDVLYVYYIKNPDKKPKEISEFLKNLEILIEDLKFEAQNENFIVKIKNLNFFIKIREFLKYSKTQNIDLNILEYMDKSLDEEINNECNHMIKVLAFPEKILEIFEKSEPIKNLNEVKLEEFLKFKQKILDGISSKDKGMIKNGMIGIFSIMIDHTIIPTEEIIYYEDELKSIIESLETIKIALDKDDNIDIQNIVENVNASVEKINKKAQSWEKASETPSQIRLSSIPISCINASDSKLNCYRKILNHAKYVRDIFQRLHSGK